MWDATKLLELMVKEGASDLYLTVDSAPMYRINGSIHPAGNEKLRPEDTEALANSIMNDQQQAQFEQEKEANLALYYSSLGRFRVNIYRQRGAVGIVIRQIKTQVPSIDDLTLPQALKELALSKRGLVLVVGATGSGKSTTLAAMMNHPKILVTKAHL